MDAHSTREKNFLENIFLKLEYVLKFIAWKCKLRLLSYPFQRHVFFSYTLSFFCLSVWTRKYGIREKVHTTNSTLNFFLVIVFIGKVQYGTLVQIYNNIP